MQKDVAELTTKPRAIALGIATCYILVGSLYIVVSDYLVYDGVLDVPARLIFLQSGKGIAFVLITGLALYAIMLLYLRKVNILLREQLHRDMALHTALERFPGPSAIFGEKGRLEFINASSLRLLGYENSQDVLQMQASDLFAPEKTGHYLAYLMEAFDIGEPTGGEVSIHYKNRDRYFMMTFVPVHGATGDVQRVIALAYDVTDRKFSAIRMEQQKRELRQIIDLIPSFVFAKDEKGRYIMANTAFCLFHGLKPEQIIGKTAEAILPDPSAAPEILRQDQEVIKSGEMVFRARYLMCDSEGRQRTFQLTKIPFRTATNNKAAILGIASDITERLESEKAVMKSQNRFRALVDHSLDALFVYDETGELTLVNDQACELLGRKRYDLLGTNFMDALVGNKPYLFDEGNLPIFYAGTCFQLTLETANGVFIPVEVRIGPLPGDDDGAFLAEVRDISERLATEQERQLMSRLGVNLSATRNAAEIAHNLFDTIREIVPLDSFFFAVRLSGRSRYGMKLIVDSINGNFTYCVSYDYQVRANSPLLPVYEGTNMLVLRNEEDDLDDRETFVNFGNQDRKSKSLMFFPVATADRVVAIMSVQSYESNAYNDETVEKVQRLANMAAPALESAHAHHQKSLFAELGRQLGAARTGEDVAEVVAILADDLTGWDSCIIGLYSRDDDSLTYIYLADEVEGRRQRIHEPNPFRKPKLFAERVLKEGPFLVLRKQHDPADTHFPSSKSKPAALSMIWVPIPGNDGPSGFISLQSYAPDAYDNDDLEATRALAEHCGAALNRTGSQELLRYREERYRKAIEATGAVTYQLDYVHNEYVFIGHEIEEITGYPPEAFNNDIWGTIILEMVLDPNCQVTYDEFNRKNFKQWKSELRIRHRNGDERWLSDQAVQMHNAAGVPIGTLGIIRDITEQKRVELALRASEQRYALSARGANDGLWDWDLQTDHIHFSERWLQMLGFNPDEIFNRAEHWYARIHPDDLELMRTTLDQHLLGITQHFECETRALHRNGTYRWMLIRGIAVRDENGKSTRIAGSQTDVTDRVLTQERLLHDSLHDPLTGLPNRTMLMEHLDRCLQRIKSDTDYRFAVVFMDLDRFKTINDSLGHLVGDHVLVTVGHRLKTTIRPTDLVARFAGDEFALVLERYNSNDEIIDVVSRVQSVVTLPIAVEHHEITTSASAGVAIGSAEYLHPSDILRDADNALYKSKSDGPGHFCIFDNSMHDHAVRMLRLEADLRRALDRQEMRIHFQPIINTDDGKVVRFEALLRWEHPELGLLKPDRFMPLAEETGLIYGLDEWVLTQSCRCLKVWNEELGMSMEDSPIRINVNLSPRHFLRPLDFTERLKSIVVAENVSPEKFGLEITENALLSFQAETTVALNTLKKEGFSLYLDDFGKGYSSLSYLHNFPFDVVKIDRLFMMRIQNEGPEREIVYTILSLASKLNLGVVAEGIETAQQLEVVKKLGCICVQGYYLSEAVPPEDVVGLLTKSEAV